MSTPDRLDRLLVLRRRPGRLARASHALLLVPLSAHALFARPLVVGADSSLAVEVLDRTDGARHPLVRRPPRRTTCRRAPASSCARSPMPVRLARLHAGPFTDRLVHKFELPVTGWRGPTGRDERVQ